MKFLMMIFFVVYGVSLFSLNASSSTCNFGDELRSSNSHWEFQSCTTAGDCNMYDYNPATGKYEYFYGRHSNCSGQQRRWIDQLTCRRNNGTEYSIREIGFWSGCELR